MSGSSQRTGLRDLIVEHLSHTPLKGPWASKFMYSLGVQFDFVTEKMQTGIKARFPDGVNQPDALPLIGADRVIPQGPGEPSTSYATRLLRWLDTWARAGNALTELQQVLAYLQVAPTVTAYRLVETVSNTSVWDVYATGADQTLPPTHIQGAGNWNWDGNTVLPWWRWWLVMFSVGSQTFVTKPPTLGTAGLKLGDPTISWGLNKPSSWSKGLRTVAQTWIRGGSWARWLIVAFDPTTFDPAQPSGIFNPDGQWGDWHKVVNGVAVRSRFSSARYIDGVS